MHGRWMTTQAQYLDEVGRWSEALGTPDWIAPQDWMCEPWILAKTGKSIDWHQDATIESVVALRDASPVDVIPVVQGWGVRDYLVHLDKYAAAGIDLTCEDTVGIGTVCRRQGTAEGAAIVETVARQGIRLHAFGFKVQGLREVWTKTVSADSMAWSFAGRKRRMEGCSHRSCANCLRWALSWRADLLRQLQPPPQGDLFMWRQR